MAVQAYSVKEGQIVDWEASVDQNGEVVLTHEDEFLKFPGGLTKPQFDKLIKAHNKANDGLVGISEEELEAQEKSVAKSQALVDFLNED